MRVETFQNSKKSAAGHRVPIALFSGSSNLPLCQAIANLLHLPLGRAKLGQFSDGEPMVEILDHVRGHDVFVLQSTSAPCNDHLMELLLMVDALRRASANRITAVIPYFGYARQDRRVRSSRVPITAKVVADMLENAGITRLVTVDLHADQIQGFFYVPVDNVYASSVFLDTMDPSRHPNPVVVSPDVGGVVRARAFAKRFQDADLAIIDKRRPQPNESRVMHIIGDVKDKTCIVVDDIVDTAGTLCVAAEALKSHGAKQVVGYCTHPVLSGDAVPKLMRSALDALYVTDTIALQAPAAHCDKITQHTLAPLLAEVIRRLSEAQSLSSMFPGT